MSSLIKCVIWLKKRGHVGEGAGNFIDIYINLRSSQMMRVNVLASVASESRPICAWALLHCITLHSLHPLTGGAPLKTVM